MLSPSIAPLLAVEGLQAWYGESHVLHGATFEVLPGEVVTLLGRNGAGKTTTLKSIMGIVGQRTGSVRYEGKELIRLTSDRIARLGIALCARRSAAFSRASASKKICCCPHGSAPAASIFRPSSSCFPTSRSACPVRERSFRAASSKCWPSAESCAREPGSCCSTSPPRVLAPVIIQQIGKTIGMLKQQGFTILLVEQNFRFASTVADRYYVVENGRIVDRFANAELEANLDKLHNYLGV